MTSRLLLPATLAALALTLSTGAALADSPGLKTLPIWADAPDFKLPGVDGKIYRLKDFADTKVLVVVFIFDKDRKLRYVGRFDDSDVKTVKSHDAINAVEAFLAGKPVPVEKTRVFGCSTKWAEKRDALLVSEGKGESEAMRQPRGHRAIGVVYHPELERGNYVSTALPRRYDALLYLEETHALHPLPVPIEPEREVPETFSSGPKRPSRHLTPRGQEPTPCWSS